MYPAPPVTRTRIATSADRPAALVRDRRREPLLLAGARGHAAGERVVEPGKPHAAHRRERRLRRTPRGEPEARGGHALDEPFIESADSGRSPRELGPAHRGIASEMPDAVRTVDEQVEACVDGIRNVGPRDDQVLRGPERPQV